MCISKGLLSANILNYFLLKDFLLFQLTNDVKLRKRTEMGVSYLFRVSIYFMDGKKAVEIKISENLNTRYFEFVVLESKM